MSNSSVKLSTVPTLHTCAFRHERPSSCGEKYSSFENRSRGLWDTILRPTGLLCDSALGRPCGERGSWGRAAVLEGYPFYPPTVTFSLSNSCSSCSAAPYSSCSAAPYSSCFASFSLSASNDSRGFSSLLTRQWPRFAGLGGAAGILLTLPMMYKKMETIDLDGLEDRCATSDVIAGIKETPHIGGPSPRLQKLSCSTGKKKRKKNAVPKRKKNKNKVRAFFVESPLRET